MLPAHSGRSAARLGRMEGTSLPTGTCAVEVDTFSGVVHNHQSCVLPPNIQKPSHCCAIGEKKGWGAVTGEGKGGQDRKGGGETESEAG